MSEICEEYYFFLDLMYDRIIPSEEDLFHWKLKEDNKILVYNLFQTNKEIYKKYPSFLFDYTKYNKLTEFYYVGEIEENEEIKESVMRYELDLSKVRKICIIDNVFQILIENRVEYIGNNYFHADLLFENYDEAKKYLDSMI